MPAHRAGRKGRSMGPVKVPLLIANSRSMGGGAILDHCIVRLFVDGREAYRHPKYNTGQFQIEEIPEGRIIGTVNLRNAGYTTAVNVDGTNRANFKTPKQAERWVSFMLGDRMAK
jgi:hypothetical protein